MALDAAIDSARSARLGCRGRSQPTFCCTSGSPAQEDEHTWLDPVKRRRDLVRARIPNYLSSNGYRKITRRIVVHAKVRTSLNCDLTDTLPCYSYNLNAPSPRPLLSAEMAPLGKTHSHSEGVCRSWK